jgi:hypothetical protein
MLCSHREVALMWSVEFRIAALALGAALLLAAVLAPRLGKRAQGGRATMWGVVAGILGAALLGWGLISSLGSGSSSPPAPVAVSTSTPAPVDLVNAASTALQACPRATAPPTAPNGNTASREQIAAATAAFKAFDTATNSYVQCVDATVARIANQYAAVASQNDLQALKEFGTAVHNTAIDQEKAVADQLNTQIRTYKAQHPRS